VTTELGRLVRNTLKESVTGPILFFPEGYTLVKGTGYFQSSSEESVIVNVLSEHDFSLGQHLEQLKRELKQEAILVAKSAVDLEVI